MSRNEVGSPGTLKFSSYLYWSLQERRQWAPSFKHNWHGLVLLMQRYTWLWHTLYAVLILSRMGLQSRISAFIGIWVLDALKMDFLMSRERSELFWKI